jgi:fructokinase
MIAVAGEALIDLVVGTDGQVNARPGGGPYNTARTLARLGRPTTFLGRLADDGFGHLLLDRLTTEGVALGAPEPSAAPSTLAVATVDQAGVASYSFYLSDTAAADLSYEALRKALPADVTAVHVGTLGLVMEPIGASIERLVLTDAPSAAIVMLDPNCRPGAVADREAYQRRIDAIARRADVVKASAEDLAYLYPGLSPEDAAKALLAAGPSLVLVTDGPRPARAFLPDSGLPDSGLPVRVLAEDVPSVTVADTIGAGDAFGGGFLAWWAANGLGRDDLRRDDLRRDDLRRDDLRRDELVGKALRAAAAVAALTCARPGADPPTLAELQTRNWWPEAR